MAINPQSVLSQLRMMSDQQLQQYAAMHKNDPFVFPLAFQESQTRKQMRSEAQAMQQPQTKVADQALASMMPEDVGIGALPAQNLEGMCGGGIVAFDEGGEVPRYAGNTDAGSLVRSTTGGKDWFLDLPDTVRDPSVPYYRQIPNPLKPLAGRTFSSRQEAIDAYNAMSGGSAAPQVVPSAATLTTPSAAYTPSVEGMLNPTTGAAQQLQSASAPAPAPAPPAPPKAPTIAPTSFKPAEAPSLTSAKELAGQLLDTGSYKSEIDKYARAEQDAVDAMRRARTEGKPQGKAYEAYESTLRDEMADLGQQKDTAKAEAWLTAGLAVLGGASPFATQNLSLAGKGVEQYRDAMKDIRRALKENAKSMADIEQARRSEARGDWEKTQEFEERANTRLANARKFGIEGLMTLGVKSAELAGRAYDTQVTQAGMDRRTMAELQSREKIAGAQLAAPSGIEKLVQRIQTDPKFAEAYEKYASIAPGVRGEYAALQKYMGPQGELSLRMLESGTPEQKAMAKAIRQKLQGMMLQPVDVANALP